METILGGMAFAGVIAAQFLAVVALDKARRESRSLERDASRADDHAQYIWKFGS